ncbi:hypothetical protein LguiA_032597 [Lonicera macranthoides]
MGRWRASLLFSRISSAISKSLTSNSSNPILYPPVLHLSPASSLPTIDFFGFRAFSALPSPSSSTLYDDEFYYRTNRFDPDLRAFDSKQDQEESSPRIPVRAFFLSTSIDLKSMQAENSRNVIPPTSRSSNSIALRFCNYPLDSSDSGINVNVSCLHYMVVFQYGSVVLFNMEDHEVESYLDIVRRHAFGLLQEMRKDDYAVKENPLLVEDMQGGPDYIVLKNLDTDSIRIIGSVLGQSLALDYFVSQVDGMVEEFTDINRGMERTGTFTMKRKKLFQLVGKANSNLADVILRVGLFDRSEIAWRDAKYAQIFEYLREEYEVTQRFGNLDFKLKFVEHNIHFLQEVLQNRKSDLLEWCIIVLLSIENVISVYEIVKESTQGMTG